MVALLVQNSEQETTLDCHGSCPIFFLASILRLSLQHEVARANWLVTPSNLQEILTYPHACSKKIQESVVARQLQLVR